MSRLFCLVGVVTILAAATLGAQDSYDATRDRLLTGTVRVGNQPPPGPAIVTLYNSIHISLGRTGTDSSGSYSFSGVGAGDLLIIVDLAGYQEASVPVRVYPSSHFTVAPAVFLKPLPGMPKLPGTVEVAELELSKDAKKQYEEGLHALSKDKLKEALQHLQRTVKLAPKFAGAEYWLGVAQSNLGDFQDAQASFRRAIKLDSNRADAFFGLAKILCMTNRPAEALSVLEKGLSLSPHSSLGLCVKSQAEYLLGNYSLAEETALQAAKESPPAPADVHLVLAKCYLRSQRYSEGVEQLRSYLKLAPDSPNAPRIRELLEKLRAAGHDPNRAKGESGMP